MDLHWRDNLIVPSEEEYLSMVMNKTGGLFRLSIRLMELFVSSGSIEDKSLVPLVNLLGMIYQIRDDYMNLRSDELQNNKGFCEDITEGKFSFPIVYGISASKEDKTLVNILKQRTTDNEIKKFAVAYLENQGSFSYTENFLDNLKTMAISILNQFGKYPELEAIILHLSTVK